MLRKLPPILITFWVGGLWMTGLTASILFDVVADRTLAGNIAGHLFSTISAIGLICGAILLIKRYVQFQSAVLKQAYWWIVIAMLLLVLVGQFGIQPLLAQLKTDALPDAVMNSQYASQFAAWHGVAGAVYLIECLLGVALVLKMQR